MNRSTNTLGSLGLFTLAGLTVLAVAACSSPPELSKIDDDCTEANPCTTTKKEAKAPRDAPVAPERPAAPTPAAPAAPPVDTSKDGVKNGDETDVDCGGTKAAKCDENKRCSTKTDCVSNDCTGGTCKPPKTPTNYCAQLPACCNTLASTLEKLACSGIQFAGKEGACQAELLLCGIGGVGGTPCGNLSKCCDQMQFEGYNQDAQDCRGHNTGNASTCSTWLSQYKNAAWCD